MPSASSARRVAIVAALLVATSGAYAQSAPLAPRQVPAKTIPVPNTVSPELQAIIAQPLRTALGHAADDARRLEAAGREHSRVGRTER